MSKGREIAFLCEFGGPKGWGHLTRCVALAQEASRRNWKTRLIGNGNEKSIPAEVRTAFSEEVSECQWMDRLPDEALAADVLFVDEMYQSDNSLQYIRERYKRAGGAAKLLVATDDMQRRVMHAVDIVVNPELGLAAAHYEPHVMSLLGERYCQLRMPFRSARFMKRRDESTTIFVMLGGTDPFRLTEKVIDALPRDRCAPIVVLGESNSRLSHCKTLLGEFARSELHQSLSGEGVADCIARSHVAAIACGASVYELAAFNLPFVGLSIVDNQTATAKKMSKLWDLPVIHCEREPLKVTEIEKALVTLMDSEAPDFYRSYSKVDGLGCSRIMDSFQKFFG